MATAEADTRVFYEIVNPSDAYTIDGTNRAAACAATLFIGDGKYALKGGDDGLVMPLFIFGGEEGLARWWGETFGGTLGDFIENNLSAIADACDSVCIGDLSHRRLVEAAMEKLPESERAAFWEKAHDERRSSMNDIGRRAKGYAKQFRSAAERE